jgi:hypothetical protein
LHMVGFGAGGWNPMLFGFDASIQHGPILKVLSRKERWRHRLRLRPSELNVESYHDYTKHSLASINSWLDYPVALSNWDNTPRSGRQGSVLEGSTPELFRRHLREALRAVNNRTADHQIVFLKSWNEWAEGNYVEPDRRFGTAYLEVIRDEVSQANVNCNNPKQIGRSSR